ncbi:MAG: hypothetical protein SF069_13060 [Phycisphaerae bacterium]|nr:hypothetical protein [Phycisphaerae bacterium]
MSLAGRAAGAYRGVEVRCARADRMPTITVGMAPAAGQTGG